MSVAAPPLPAVETKPDVEIAPARESDTAELVAPVLAPAPVAKPATSEMPLLPAKAQRMVFVDALRGLAALGVACYHINRYGPLAEPASEVIPEWLAFVIDRGWIGVQVFFVISGFVIAYSVRNARITGKYLGTFALRRSIRLDPPYWATIVIVLLLGAATYSAADPDPLIGPVTWQQCLAHLGYAQNICGYGNISVGFWTLCIEVQFYLLYICLMWLVQRFPGRGAEDGNPAPCGARILWFAPLAVYSLFVCSHQSSLDMWIIHFFSMFFLGLLAWWALDDRVPSRVFWGYAALFVVRLSIDWAFEYAVALAAGVAIYVVGRRGRLDTWLGASWLQYLGRISYSLYLIHYPVSWLIGRLGYRLTGDSPMAAAGWLLLAVLTSIAAAHILCALVETPSIRFARRFKLAH